VAKTDRHRVPPRARRTVPLHFPVARRRDISVPLVSSCGSRGTKGRQECRPSLGALGKDRAPCKTKLNPVPFRSVLEFRISEAKWRNDSATSLDRTLPPNPLAQHHLRSATIGPSPLPPLTQSKIPPQRQTGMSAPHSPEPLALFSPAPQASAPPKTGQNSSAVSRYFQIFNKPLVIRVIFPENSIAR